jgi:hypothetical protein
MEEKEVTDNSMITNIKADLKGRAPFEGDSKNG